MKGIGGYPQSDEVEALRKRVEVVEPLVRTPAINALFRLDIPQSPEDRIGMLNVFLLWKSMHGSQLEFVAGSGIRNAILPNKVFGMHESTARGLI